MVYQRNERGFTIWELLLILFVLLLLLLGGWWVWQNNKEDEPSSESTSQNQQEQAQEPQQNNKEYMEIAEWDVRVTLSADNTGGYYYIGQSGPNYAYLSTNALQNTECAADKTTVGVYTRFTQNEMHPITEEPYIQMYPNAPKVGNYYFVFDQPQAYCSDDPAVRAEAEAAKNAFKADLATIEAIP